jgi:hypothetical protein
MLGRHCPAAYLVASRASVILLATPDAGAHALPARKGVLNAALGEQTWNINPAKQNTP